MRTVTGSLPPPRLRQRTATMRAGRCGERGEVTATVIMVPLVLAAVMLFIQFGLAYYARQVLAGAAHDGAAAAARYGSSVDAGVALSTQLLDEAASSLLVTSSATGAVTGHRVTITTTGQVVSLIPFGPSITVSATGSAPIEAFHPEGAP
jgi:Flp pilus assembly protein TadG